MIASLYRVCTSSGCGPYLGMIVSAEPRLGAERFFELYCETWRRSILNLSGNKSWRDWAHQVRARELPLLTHMLLRT
jgi:hypothetical protein